MMKIITSAVLCCFVFTTGIAQSINDAKSVVSFEISNIRINTVSGTFKGMKGTVNFSPNNPSASSFNVCINAASINTGNEKRDKHLRTADFFDVEKYPQICFTSGSIIKTANGYVAKGALTMHGITKEVQIPFTFSNNVFNGTLKLKRLDYKVGENTGTFMVGNEVDITITCILNQ